MYIAHLNTMNESIIEFHLNITSGDKIPRPGAKVFASVDNGRTGRRAKIIEITGLTRFHASDRFNWHLPPFASVEYKAVIIE
jgi:hypothetical protein